MLRGCSFGAFRPRVLVFPNQMSPVFLGEIGELCVVSSSIVHNGPYGAFRSWQLERKLLQVSHLGPAVTIVGTGMRSLKRSRFFARVLYKTCLLILLSSSSSIISSFSSNINILLIPFNLFFTSIFLPINLYQFLTFPLKKTAAKMQFSTLFISALALGSTTIASSEIERRGYSQTQGYSASSACSSFSNAVYGMKSSFPGYSNSISQFAFIRAF